MKLDISGIDIALSFDSSAIPKAVDAAMPELVSSTKSAVSSHRRTGALVSSVGASKCKPKNGGYYAGITFKGTDEFGIRNGIKAAQLEYGNSRQTATPFADRAAKSAESKITKIVEDHLKDALKVGE